MKKMHTTRAGFTVAVALVGYGAGLVSVQPSIARPDNGNGDTTNNGVRNGGRDGGGRGVGGPGMGGRGMRDGKARGPMLNELLNEMDLTLAQQTRIQAALDSERTQIEALRAHMEAVQERTRAAIDATLTDEQRAQLAAEETEMAAQREERRGGRDGGPGRGGEGDFDGPRPGGRDGGGRGGDQGGMQNGRRGGGR